MPYLCLNYNIPIWLMITKTTKEKMLNIEKHSHDGFTLSNYVKTKIGQEVDVSKRYIGYSMTDAKKLFSQLCKEVRNKEEYISYGVYK